VLVIRYGHRAVSNNDAVGGTEAFRDIFGHINSLFEHDLGRGAILLCGLIQLHDVSRIALGALLHFSVVELQLFLRVTDFLAQCLAYQIFAKLVSLCSLRSKVAFGIGELLRESCGRRTGKHSGDGRRSHPRVCFRRHYIIASNSASIAG